MENSTSFTAEQAALANTALREALGLAPEKFSTEQFVGMISEEIEQLRAAGKSDAEISNLLETKVGVRVDEDSIKRFYTSESERVGYP